MTDGNSRLFLGPLEELAYDYAVTDIAVTCEGRVWVDRGGGMEEYHPYIAFRTPRMVRDFAVQLCAQMGRRLDDACPIADASSVSGIRVHAVIAPLVPQGASVSIRFPGYETPSLESLAARGLLPVSMLPLMRSLVAHKATLLITGGTGAGKTTLLKALLAECDSTERIITVEEARELGTLGRGNHVSLVSREANVEGAGAIGLPQLVKATLRMRPDRVVLGECRGEEVADLLRALNSGHHGGMTTMHADGVSRVPARLTSLGMLAGVEPRAIAMLSEGAFDAVIHVERRGRRRYIAQIGRLILSNGHLVGVPVLSWDGTGAVSLSDSWESFYHQWWQESAV